MKVIGLAGYSGAGKTTLVLKLIPLLKSRGYSIATLKHAHHKFDVDKPGKDSYEHRKAGAHQVLIASSQRWALMNENQGSQEPSLEFLLSRLSPVDLVLVEGFKTEKHPVIEVCRDPTSQRLEGISPNLVGLVTDLNAGIRSTLPTFDINQPANWLDDLLSLSVTIDAIDWS